jgi:formate C-acetyltransferase
LTALLNSGSRIPFHRITGGPLNLRIHPTAVEGHGGVKILAALLQTYLETGGMQVQINVVSKEQLLDAQKNPDRYRGLCVRVVGYSAYFVQMGRKAQEEVIRRTEHA